MRPRISILKRVLMLCEDEKSSLYYLKSFKSDEELRRKLASIEIKVIHPEDFSPLGLIREAIDLKKNAIREKNKYDEIWAVFDRNGHKYIPDAFSLAHQNKINIAYSSICFEYWILLHFEKTRRAFHNCDEVRKYLMHKYFPEYQKNKNCFSALRDRIEIAIENGDWIYEEVEKDIKNGMSLFEMDSYTSMSKLVRKLYKPEIYLL